MIVKVDKKELNHLIEKGKKEDLCFSQRTKYLAYKKNGEIVCMGGYIENKLIITVKNLYVPENHRGNGYFKEMLTYIMNIDKSKTYNAKCTKYSIKEFLKRGFKVKKTYKNGIQEVIYENI